MRCHVLITLLRMHVRRNLAHRGGLVLLLVLALVSGGLAILNRGYDFTLGAPVKTCFVDYWQDGPWIEHLRASVPAELEGHVQFRAIEQVAAAGETIYYPSGTGAIQIRGAGDGRSGNGCKVWMWYPGTINAAMTAYESWFWQETARYFRQKSAQMPAPSNPGAIPELEVERSSLAGSADTRTTTTTALLIFPLFLSCVYLLPIWMCEERERGQLLAVALSPATPLEMLAARACFCAALGMAFAALVAAVSCPAVLGQVWFWATLFVGALGAAGVGATIGCMARRQRTASLAALAYLVAVAGIMSLGQAIGATPISCLTLEYHLPRLLHAALSGMADAQQGSHLAAALALALAWFILAMSLFRKRGWQ